MVTQASRAVLAGIVTDKGHYWTHVMLFGRLSPQGTLVSSNASCST